MLYPVIGSGLLSPLVNPLSVLARHGGGSTLPRLQPGEYFLTDENGNYLIGKDS